MHNLAQAWGIKLNPKSEQPTGSKLCHVTQRVSVALQGNWKLVLHLVGNEVASAKSGVRALMRPTDLKKAGFNTSPF